MDLQQEQGMTAATARNGAVAGCRGEREMIVRLPVAPQLLARTRFSPPPPKASRCLSGEQALALLARQREEHGDRVAMAAIAGPGDPLATPEPTLALAAEIGRRHPGLAIGLLTCGLGSGNLAGELAAAGVSYVEMQVEAVKTEILEKLFAWVRPGAKTVRLREGVALLLQEQRRGVSALCFNGVRVNILTTLYPGYNNSQTGKISSEMKEFGAASISVAPYVPEPGAEVDLESPSAEEMEAARRLAAVHLPLARALLPGSGLAEVDRWAGGAAPLPAPTAARPNVAVVSSTGIEVDLHLGQASRFLIYGPRPDGLTSLLEVRPAPEPGSGQERWRQAAAILADCFVLLASSAGTTPRTILAEEGLPVHLGTEQIEALVDALYPGGGKRKQRRR